MGTNDFSNLGEDIKKYVDNALNSNDFKQLNKDIGNTVNAALDEMKEAFEYGCEHLSKINIKKDPALREKQSKKSHIQKETMGESVKKETERAQGQAYQRTYKGPDEGNYRIIKNRSGKFEKVYITKEPSIHDGTDTQEASNQELTENTMPSPSRNILPGVQKKPGKAGGIFLSGLGITGILGSAGLTTAVALEGMWLALSAPALLLLFSTFSISKGMIKIGRAKRFQVYAEELCKKGYCTIEQLSETLDKKESYVIKDLKKMVKLKIFPQGRLDEDKTCFMIDDKVYATYLEMREYQRERQREQELAREMGISPEVQKILDEGREYVRQIKLANESISGQAFSEKLLRLETVIGEIFDFIEEHPQEKWDIQKFMEYYLPTALKLVQAYQDFDSQLVKGSNITKAKAEIEDTLETINEAFERLLDSMFAEAALDVSTDISVLETMLAQEGLIKDPF